MLKRPNDEDVLSSESSSPDLSPSPRKRSKAENDAGGDAGLVIVDRSNSPLGPLDGESGGEGSVAPIRDEEYYFEDGSVILLIDNVLFKVHASFLKAQSDTFKDLLNMPPANASEDPKGTSDENPIVISKIKSTQFRNFMKIFYELPSARPFSTICADDKNNKDAWQNFKFYSDVARLSHRFGMADAEQWARSQLKCLTRIGAAIISSQAEGDDTLISYSLDTLWYTKTTPDFRLPNNVRNLIQYFCYKTEDLSDSNIFLLFQTPNLHKDDPPLFGFLFILILSLGYEVWDTYIFTNKDRMAFFYAHCYLMPFPSSLKASLETPLFVKPVSAAAFSKILAGGSNARPCLDKCHRAVFSAWGAVFDEGYYEGVSSQDARTAFGILATLPSYRRFFFNRMDRSRCSQDCYQRIADQLDRDINQLFTRVAGYYREI